MLVAVNRSVWVLEVFLLSISSPLLVAGAAAAYAVYLGHISMSLHFPTFFRLLLVILNRHMGCNILTLRSRCYMMSETSQLTLAVVPDRSLGEVLVGISAFVVV